MRDRLLATMMVALATVCPAVAQTYTWTGGGGNGNWSTAANWTGGTPTSTNTTIIELSGTTQTTTNQNIASPFILNQLNMLADATNGFVVNGGQLQFAGAGAQIRNAAQALLQVNSAIDFAANTTIDLRANNLNAREGEFNGRLTAASGTTVTFTTTGAPNTIGVIQGTNYGFLGTVNVTGGAIVHTTGANTLSRTASVNTVGASSYVVGTLAASGLTATGANVQLGAFSGEGQLSLGDNTITSSALVGFRNNAVDTVSGNLAVGNANSHLGKVGTGEWRFNGTTASTVTGSVSVRDGLLNFSSGSGSAGGFGTTSTGRIRIYSGGEVRLTMTGNGTDGRLGSDQPVTLQGGILRLNGSELGTSGGGFSEVTGALTIGAGQSTVRVDTDSDGIRGARFNFASLTNPSSTTGSVVFLSNSLGVSPLGTGGSGNVNFEASINSQLVGTSTTYAPNTKNMAILPYAIGATVSGALPATFVTYDSTNGSIRGLGDSNYDTAFGTADSNVTLSGTTIVATPTTANALRMTDTGTVVNSSTLTLTSGGLLFTGSTGNGISGSGETVFGTGGTRTAFITATSGTSTMSGAIRAANLSKNGAGGLTLGGTTTLTGTAGNTVAVNAGTLALNGATITTTNALSATNTLTYQVSRGAALDMSAGGLTVGNFTTLTGGAGTAATGTANQARVVGDVTVNSGGTIAPSALGGPQASLASPGALTVAGNVTLNGGSNYVWTVNSAVTNGDNTVAPTSGTLNNFKSPYTASLLSTTGTLDLTGASSGNRINLRLTSLALSNESGPVYDLFDGTTRSWVLIEAGGINGFSADKFTFDVSAFQNVTADRLSISQVGNSLVLTFTPVPEPAAMLAVAAAVTAGGVAWRRFRRRPVEVTPTTAV